MTRENFKRYKRYRQVTVNNIIPMVKEIGEYKTAEHMLDCGKFIKIAKCENCGEQHFKGYTSCDSRWCLNCMHKRMLCWMVHLIPIFQDWLAQGNYLTMLNFTVRDGFPLKERLELLSKAYREMTAKDKNSMALWKERFPGGIRSLEVKLGKNSGAWHPHYHCLVMQEGGMGYVKDFNWLSAAWHKQVGFNTTQIKLLCDGSIVEIADEVTRADGTWDCDWNGNVFIKKIAVKPGRYGRYGNRSPSMLLSAVCETLKYIVKIEPAIFGSMTRQPKGKEIKPNVELFEELYRTLKNKRQVSTWGLLHGIKDAEKDTGSKSEQDMIEFICQRCGCTEAQLLSVLYGQVAKKNLMDMTPARRKGKKITLPARRGIL